MLTGCFFWVGVVSVNVLAVLDGVTVALTVTIPPKVDVFFITTSEPEEITLVESGRAGLVAIHEDRCRIRRTGAVSAPAAEG